MKIQANVRIYKTIEMEVDEKFRKLDGWHDISNKEEVDLRWELEKIILENNADYDEVDCVWADDTEEMLLEN